MALWIFVLIGAKFYASALYPSDKDARQFAMTMRPMLPGHPNEILFVEDMTRNGLNLYFDSDIERLSFKPMPKMMSDSSYDQTVAEELGETERQRIFIMKREVERYFVNEVVAAGRQPVKLGVVHEANGRADRDHLVYTLAGDFPKSSRPTASLPIENVDQSPTNRTP